MFYHHSNPCAELDSVSIQNLSFFFEYKIYLKEHIIVGYGLLIKYKYFHNHQIFYINL